MSLPHRWTPLSEDPDVEHIAGFDVGLEAGTVALRLIKLPEVYEVGRARVLMDKTARAFVIDGLRRRAVAELGFHELAKPCTIYVLERDGPLTRLEIMDRIRSLTRIECWNAWLAWNYGVTS